MLRHRAASSGGKGDDEKFAENSRREKKEDDANMSKRWQRRPEDLALAILVCVGHSVAFMEQQFF